MAVQDQRVVHALHSKTSPKRSLCYFSDCAGNEAIVVYKEIYCLRDSLGKVFEKDNPASFPKTIHILTQCSMTLACAFIFGDLRSGNALLCCIYFTLNGANLAPSHPSFSASSTATLQVQWCMQGRFAHLSCAAPKWDNSK